VPIGQSFVDTVPLLIDIEKTSPATGGHPDKSKQSATPNEVGFTTVKLKIALDSATPANGKTLNSNTDRLSFARLGIPP
jgi:hypothetical protein